MWFKYIRENEGEIKNGQSRETCNNGYARGKTKKKSTTQIYIGDKGNNKITELRTILRRESQN